MHIPSLVMAWSSGKLGDWYPDLLDEQSGRLVLYKQKPGWQQGWFAQHQRLIEALAAQKKRSGVVVQGDMHASAAGKMTRSGELTLSNPVHFILNGTLGTGDLAVPILLPQHRIKAFKTGGNGRGAQANGEKRLHSNRCHAREDDIHDVRVAPAAAGRGNRHHEARACL